MEDSGLDNSLLQVAAVRKECAALRAHFAGENARLEALCAQQQEEIARLRGSNRCESCGGDKDKAASAAMVEVVRELERSEQALQQERRNSTKLADDKNACEENHSRDVAMLEGMLQQTLTENERLQATVSALRASCVLATIPEVIDAEKSGLPLKDAIEDEAGKNQNLASEVLEEPEMEPRRVPALDNL
jgi:hypothetical protein